MGQRRFAEDLQRLRADAGDVSYGELAARITAAREARGASAAAARIARSTVYDAFRPDRTRLNPALIAEIVEALGLGEEEAERWRQEALQQRVAAASAPVEPLAVVEPARRWRWPTAFPTPLDPVLLLALVAAGIGANRFGGDVSGSFWLPIWLDTVGTALIAIRVGPWAGAGVAVGGALLGAIPDGAEYLWYGLVSVVAALVWGYGARRWGLLRTPLRFLGLGLLVGLACTCAAVPIAVLVYGGEPQHGYEQLVRALLDRGVGRLPAIAFGNLLASVTDKVLSGFLAVLALVLLQGRTAR